MEMLDSVKLTIAPMLTGELARIWAARNKLDKLVPALNARVRLRGASRLGSRVTLRGHPTVSNEGLLTVGDRVRLVSTVATLELVSLPGGHLEIGENTLINYGSSLVASNHVKVGKDCLIGTHVMIMDCDFHRVEDKTWDTTGSPIIIEDRVWICNRSIICKGVRIGHDAVVAGVPARVVREF